ncbi:MAG: beta-lactamase family protein [Prolixibacteraceae bacterium]|nr:beta-lactamase family protein [Prolixibacteraceae bacterium]
MKTRFLLFLFLICIHFLAVAQPAVLTEGAPALVGMSDKKLAQIDQFIQDYVNKGYIPGGVILIARDNQIVYYKNFGFRTTDKKAAYQKDDIFRIASMTKAVTSVAIMQLYEQGKLGLDDPVQNYIPAFKNSKVLDQFNEKDSSYTAVPAKSPITIRQLLTHSSGIVYGAFSQGALRAIYAKKGLMDVGLSHTKMTTEEFINRLAEVPLAFHPGEKYTYGLNMDVLGRVVEVVSGSKLSDYFRKNIFEPLGMKNTFFYLPKEKQAKLVPIYLQKEDGTLEMATNTGGISSGMDYPLQTDNNHYAGGGGLSSTALDYATFIQALLNNGHYNGKRILSRKTVEVMTADQMIGLNMEGKGYSRKPGETFCLGFSLITDQGKGISVKSPGTYEWGGYFNTKFFIDPKEQLIFVGMTQILGARHGELWDRLAAIMYSAIED